MSGIMESSNQSNLTTVAETSVEQHTNSYNSNGDASSQVSQVNIVIVYYTVLILYFLNVIL